MTQLLPAAGGRRVALAWLAIPILGLLAWHGELQHESALRIGSVLALWMLASVLNARLYLKSRQWRRPPLVILWFLGLSAVCAVALLATGFGIWARYPFGIMALVIMAGVPLAPQLAPWLHACSLVGLIPRPGTRAGAASVFAVLASAVLDGCVFGVGTLLECAVAWVFVMTALEQQPAGVSWAAGATGRAIPHGASEVAA